MVLWAITGTALGGTPGLHKHVMNLALFCCAQVPQWSRVGRLKRSAFPNLASGGGHSFGGGAGPGLMAALAGRLICDTYLGARELLHEVDYTMTTLARIHLGQTRSDLAAADVPGIAPDAPELLVFSCHPCRSPPTLTWISDRRLDRCRGLIRYFWVQGEAMQVQSRPV